MFESLNREGNTGGGRRKQSLVQAEGSQELARRSMLKKEVRFFRMKLRNVCRLKPTKGGSLVFRSKGVKKRPFRGCRQGSRGGKEKPTGREFLLVQKRQRGFGAGENSMKSLGKPKGTDENLREKEKLTQRGDKARFSRGGESGGDSFMKERKENRPSKRKLWRGGKGNFKSRRRKKIGRPELFDRGREGEGVLRKF